jgi:hypothetical protein
VPVVPVPEDEPLVDVLPVGDETADVVAGAFAQPAIRIAIITARAASPRRMDQTFPRPPWDDVPPGSINASTSSIAPGDEADQ